MNTGPYIEKQMITAKQAQQYLWEAAVLIDQIIPIPGDRFAIKNKLMQVESFISDIQDMLTEEGGEIKIRTATAEEMKEGHSATTATSLTTTTPYLTRPQPHVMFPGPSLSKQLFTFLDEEVNKKIDESFRQQTKKISG